MFGEKVEQIIKGLKDISHIYATQRIVNSENFRKLLLSFAEDIRVQLIFLQTICKRINKGVVLRV